MRSALIITLLIVGILYAGYLCKDVWQHRQEMRVAKPAGIWVAISGVFIFLLSTLGVSDFAVSTAIYSPTKWVTMKKLPGTLNVQGVLPFVVMGIGFTGVVNVAPLTLVLLVGSQVIGAILSPRLVVKLPERTIKWWIACGLVVAGGFILASRLHLIAGNGTATELTGLKLFIGCLLQMVYGALNNIGIGSYALTTATVYALGLNPLVAFPVMMSGSALSVAAGSSLFIHYGDYNRKVAVIATSFGLLGVLLGLFVFAHFNVAIVTWIVIGVLFYTAGNLFHGLAQQRRVEK